MNITETKQRELQHFLETVLPQMRIPGLLLFREGQENEVHQALKDYQYMESDDDTTTLQLLEEGKRVAVMVTDDAFPQKYRALIAQYTGGDIINHNQDLTSVQSIPVGEGKSALVFVMTRERLNTLETEEAFPCREECSLTLDVS